MCMILALFKIYIRCQRDQFHVFLYADITCGFRVYFLRSFVLTQYQRVTYRQPDTLLIASMSALCSCVVLTLTPVKRLKMP